MNSRLKSVLRRPPPFHKTSTMLRRNSSIRSIPEFQLMYWRRLSNCSSAPTFFRTTIMRILQPQTESGPRNYFFIFFILFFIFFLFHIILRSCEIFIFIFFIPQLCGNVILICLSCFPHVQLIVSCAYLFLLD